MLAFSPMPNIPGHLRDLSIDEDSDASGDDVKEVYAHFGLAIYHAQVLEAGLVNALLSFDFIPSQNPTTIREWQSKFDDYAEQSFSQTMGQLLKSMRRVGRFDPSLELDLSAALKKRNFLVHHFFRERAEAFMTKKGRAVCLAKFKISGRF